ncbi:MAG TPA: carboxypeptidase-like regulatory domain-containing protein [Gemmatimonadaceae bacterium]|nr:carboxypeptidase-like regulatory domain-containing protein [Gemmatimonadaceae bacterium]
MSRHTPLRIAIAVAAAVAGSAAQGQSTVLRGTVVEAGGRRPIPGAVVAVLDSSGAVQTRTIADETGTWSAPLPAGAARVRVIRIGFRPNEAAIPAVGADGTVRVDVALTMIPTFLEPARVRALQCPKRRDAEQAYGLWEQARAGLLAGLVAREAKPAAIVRIAYRQTMRGVSDDVESQVIVVDSVSRTANAYRAPFDASRFLQYGFSDDSAGRRYFSAPDAEVLLDPAFGNGYCFRIADRDGARPTQVGLGFSPADRQPGRVDIDGVLWVDTVARGIRDIVFRYTNLDRAAAGTGTGGTVSFTDLPNGVVFLDRWRLRLPTTVVDTGWRDGLVSRVRLVPAIAASGGEVAHAAWEDGTRFDAHLGALAAGVRALDGAPAVGRLLYLAGTSYGALVDSAGTFAVRDLLPGPYLVVAREKRLERLHMDSIPTTLAFIAARDSVVHATLVAPSLEEWVGLRCRGGRRPAGGRPATDQTMVLARVLDARRQPVADVEYVVEIASPASRTGWAQVARGRTHEDGLLQVCTDAAAPGQRIAVTLRRGGTTLGRLEQDLAADPLTIIPLILKR